MARRQQLAWLDLGAFAATAFLWVVLRYPKRAIYAAAWTILAGALCAATVAGYDAAVRPPSIGWSVVGALSATAILGSVNLAMILGHWYLVVRGMPIEPLKRLSISFIVAAVLRVAVIAIVLLSLSEAELFRVAVANGIFFWMRVGWGLLGPLVLFPMIWGTVRIRSTMAATGILYVAVVAVVIGEVLSTYLSAIQQIPL
jgi:hypothetical protein